MKRPEHRSSLWLAIGVWTGLSAGASAWAADFGPNTCLEGYVWRGAFPGDFVCVAPEVRDQVVADNRDAPLRTKSWLTDVHGRPSRACRNTFFPRKAGPDDLVCVKEKERDQAAADNLEAPKRLKYPICQYYATLAVAQNQTNLNKGCGLSGARWQSSFDVHFRWCLDVVKEQSDAEIRARSIDIGPCLSRGSSGSSAQAQLAVSLQFAAGDLANRNLVVTGSGFQANEKVAISLTTQSLNQGPSTSEILTTANSLGQISATVGVRCPVGTSTTHQATARGLTSNRSSTAGSAC